MFWKRKKQTKNNYSEQEIIGALLQDFMNNGDLYPVFIHGISSEQDADAINWKDLPLVYIWNEHYIGDDLHYSLSINGPFVGIMLETFIPRESPNFDHIRDKTMAVIRDVSSMSVSSTCSKTGMTPSQLFSK